MKSPLRSLAAAALACVALAAMSAASALRAAQPRPNVLWFIVDDMSANFSSYGEKLIVTPHVDRLAREGVRFSRAFTTAPVCSPCRSAFITGMYQTTIGAHHHRSGRGAEKIMLPAGVVPVPKLFQDAGYFTAIGSGLPATNRAGKAKAARKNPPTARAAATASARPTTTSSGTRKSTTPPTGPGANPASRSSCRCSSRGASCAAARMPTAHPL